MLIRQVRTIAWVWTAAFLAAALAVQAIAVQLKNPMWFVLPGGRSSAASVHAFVPVHLLLVSWAVFLLFIVCVLVSRELTSPRRAWPMVLLMLLGVLGAKFFAAAATGSILQLGHDRLTEAEATRLLIGPAESISNLTTIVALLSLVVIPGIIAAVRASRARSAKEPS